MPWSRLGLETERLGLGLGLDTEGLGLGLGLGSKCCLNMPLRFSFSSRLPRLLFRTSVIGMMWMWGVALVLTPQSPGHLEVQ